MKILITGGAGFIGQNLTGHLQRLGHDVVILDSLEEQIHGKTHSSKLQKFIQSVDFIHGSVTDPVAVARAIQQVDIIYHLAAETGTGQSMYDISKYILVNVGGTGVILEQILKTGTKLKKLVLASSRSVYGEGKYSCPEHGFFYPIDRTETDLKNGHFDFNCPHCFKVSEPVATDEKSPAQPKSLYALTKFQQEQLFELYSSILPAQFLIYRFQNVYGPGQSLKNPYTGILSIFSSLIRSKKEISIFEDGLESRDFVYIDDVTAALIAGLNFHSEKCEIFNVGSGVKTSVNDLIKKLETYFGSEKVVSKITGQYRVGDIRHNFADLTRLQSVLKVSPKTSFDAGITSFLNWALNEDYTGDAYEKSLDELKQRGLLKS